MFNDSFPAYYGRVNNRSQNTYLGLKYQLSKIDSYLESSFYEITRPDFGKNVRICNNGCVDTVFDTGAYYRAEGEMNFLKNLIKDRVSIGGGIRYIHSNLTDNNRYSYLIHYDSKSFGPQFSIRLRTKEFGGFFFSFALDLFYLRGSILNRVHNLYQYSPGGYYEYSTRNNSIYRGTEFEVAANYCLTESIVITGGLQLINARVIPNSKDVISNDSIHDLNQNFRSRANANYYDSLSTIYLQITLRNSKSLF